MLSMDIVNDYSSAVKLDEDAIKKIEAIDGIAEISPMFSTAAQMKIGDTTGGISVNLSKASFLRLSGIKVMDCGSSF